ncbi:deaminase [Streptomyces sp. S.PB5]|uniref:deaminase n=1 Tax=Streptomyces sp. S.PB5 TaxID=3020844 RepID=UPI0025B029F0|nr:deaminase [Streptomyces sp. S.PB5]MDN3026010.1 deaminase [Streptomyces sp. S.PB5]
MNLIRLAIRQAIQSQCRHRVGAVLAAGSRVVVASPNKYRNSPLIDHENSTFHAEDAALRRARGAPVSMVFVARVNAACVPMLARPCAGCVGKLAQAGVLRAYYTAGPTAVEVLEIPPIHSRVVPD